MDPLIGDMGRVVEVRGTRIVSEEDDDRDDDARDDHHDDGERNNGKRRLALTHV